MMEKDKYKLQFASVVSQAFRDLFSDAYKTTGDNQVFDREYVYEHLDKPKDPALARFAFPVFRFGKLLGDKPPSIAARVAEHCSKLLKSDRNGGPLVTVSSTSGFLNATIDSRTLASETLSQILSSESAYADSNVGQGRKVLVEYSSVNIAKPFGIAHLRTTILGNSLRRIFKKLGYDVVGINFIGDWGTQFGKMIVAYKKWGEGVDLDQNPVEQLYRLYVRFHEEAKSDTSLDDEARRQFKLLEDGDQEAVDLWSRFRDLSLREFEAIYQRLGIDFDVITGESALNDKMESVIERFRSAGLTSISDGALIVELHDDRLPPCLLRKADGATLYATRDLAGLVHRWEEYRFHESLYVVAVSQSDHFAQAFKAMQLLEEAEQLPPDKRMTGRVRHVDFGWVKFGDKGMSTRAGTIIFLEDVLNKATDLARTIIVDKNPDLKEIDRTAEMIGVGAVLFSQMSVRRQKDVNFVWEQVLSFEGETGPYLQYTHARLCSLLRNYGREISSEIDADLLDGSEEKRLIEHLADFSAAVVDAGRLYDPNLITTYLLRLASGFNKLYQRKDDNGRIDRIISEDAKLTAARIALVKSVQIVLREGLRLLAIEAPQEM